MIGRRTFLAWHLLMKQKMRLLVAIMGIAFANMLIFMQLGFRGALFDSNCRPQLALDTDLVVVNSQLETVHSLKEFGRDKLLMCLGHPEVRDVTPLLVSMAEWKNPLDKTTRQLLVFGMDPQNPAFPRDIATGHWDELNQLQKVFFDRASRPEFGPIPKLWQEQGPITAEAEKVKIEVVGLFTLGANFAADGNLITSLSTFLRLFPRHSPDTMEVGLVRLRASADAQTVANQLQAHLGTAQLVLTRQQFADREKEYWQRSTSIGFIFGLGVVIGFIVGLVIVYQVLSSDVNDHLAEYATLKAMGYSDLYLVGVFAQESLLLALFGFGPGLMIGLGLYHKAAAATTLPLVMTTERAGGVFLATLAMCFASGLVAAFKLKSADPADIF